MFLTFITRCCRRPTQLEKNIQSVLKQTSEDWEQIFLVDLTGKHKGDPIVWANAQFERYQHLPKGGYVYPLDDDGWLVDVRFVELIQRCARKSFGPEVILVKNRTFNLDRVLRIHPHYKIWGLDWEDGERPGYWVGTGANVVTRTDVWKRHLKHYQYSPGGDHRYISSLIRDEKLRFARQDVLSTESSGRGCGVLTEKCKEDWFAPIAAFYRMEQLEPNAWRLRP